MRTRDNIPHRSDVAVGGDCGDVLDVVVVVGAGGICAQRRGGVSSRFARRRLWWNRLRSCLLLWMLLLLLSQVARRLARVMISAQLLLLLMILLTVVEAGTAVSCVAGQRRSGRGCQCRLQSHVHEHQTLLCERQRRHPRLDVLLRRCRADQPTQVPHKVVARLQRCQRGSNATHAPENVVG